MTKKKPGESENKRSKLLRFALEDVVSHFCVGIENAFDAAPQHRSSAKRAAAKKGLVVEHSPQILVDSFQATLLNPDLTSQRVRDRRAVLLYLLSIASLPSDSQPRWFARAPRRKDEHDDK